jgi:hypothetical protein
MPIGIRVLLLVLVLLLASAAFAPMQPAVAQSDPNASIQFPPPVYLLSGFFTVRGTANLPNMQAYFLEFRPLVDAVTPADASVGWAPATLPAAGPVINDVLGVWNTTLLPDGLYELRLTILTTSTAPVYANVSPLRIENFPLFATPSPTPFPTLIPPTPTLFLPPPTAVNTNPTATATINANVRAGDGTFYAAIGFLLQGQSAPLIGVSSTGSGWWVIQLSDGRSGFISPTVVQVTGDLSRLASIVPPPLPTLTPLPRPTATAVSRPLPDASIIRVYFNHDPSVNHRFDTTVTVYNNSPSRLHTVSVACNFTPMNVFVSRNINGVDPFQQRDVTFRNVLLREGGGANFNAECAVDLNNLVAESNETNNYFTRTELLRN